MPNTRSVISALPLIADALGRKYGVKVIIGGSRAYTNGRDIHIPSLPLDSDESVLNIARGFLDHEAAHLRMTDFDSMKAANFSPIEKHVWNLLEDYMVEQRLAALYPGCGQNFNWLIRHLFLGQITDDSEQGNSPINHIFNWMLYCLRSLSVPELGAERDRLAVMIESKWPDLRVRLDPIVQSVPLKCHDTKGCIDVAREIVAVLKDYIQNQQQKQPKQKSGQSQPSPCSMQGSEPQQSEINANNGEEHGNEQEDAQSKPEEACNNDNTGKAHSQSGEQEDTEHPTGNNQDGQQEAGQASDPLEMLADAIENLENLEPMDIGELAGKELERMEDEDVQDKLSVAIAVPAHCKPYMPDELRQIRQETAALRTRLNGLLQAKEEARTHIARTGKVDLRRVARLACQETRIFARRATRQGINTAIHVLLDASYSMEHGKMELAAKAAYALASALSNVRGVNVGVTAFPAPLCVETMVNHADATTVAVIKRHGQPFHDNFHVKCCGGTPLAEALWWLLQEIQAQRENRKIVLILSDGFPDNTSMAKAALAAHASHGIEVYGIGIQTPAMTRLLPEQRSRAIYDLHDLAPAVFELLKSALLKPSGGDYENAC